MQVWGKAGMWVGETRDLCFSSERLRSCRFGQRCNQEPIRLIVGPLPLGHTDQLRGVQGNRRSFTERRADAAGVVEYESINYEVKVAILTVDQLPDGSHVPEYGRVQACAPCLLGAARSNC